MSVTSSINVAFFYPDCLGTIFFCILLEKYLNILLLNKFMLFKLTAWSVILWFLCIIKDKIKKWILFYFSGIRSNSKIKSRVTIECYWIWIQQVIISGDLTISSTVGDALIINKHQWIQMKDYQLNWYMTQNRSSGYFLLVVSFFFNHLIVF